VQQRFFEELASLLEQVATYTVPIYITGDFNIRLDRPDDEHAIQLRQLVDCYGLMLHDTVSTHQHGGTLDAVVTRDDVGRPDSVAVVDVGLSDHHLLQWSVAAARSPPSVEVVQTRPWRKLDVSELGLCYRCLCFASLSRGRMTSTRWLRCTIVNLARYSIS